MNMTSPTSWAVSILIVSTSIIEAAFGPICTGSISIPPDTTAEKYLKRHCCQGRRDSDGSPSISWFPCQTGCCGDPDNNQCCGGDGLTNTQIGIIAGCTVLVCLLVIGLIIVLLCKKRRVVDKDGSDHGKILEEVYSAQSLDEVFTLAHHLVSAPGTIVHPMTNMNSLYTIGTEQSYVIPPPDQPQPPPITVTGPPADNDSSNLGDEENWDQWDGFPGAGSGDVGTASAAAAPSAGRGRDAPFYPGDGEDAGHDEERPHYYEVYDRYMQPPPAYEAVTQPGSEASAPPS